MSTVVLDKLERFAKIAERFEGLVKTVPRLAEMFGVAFFAGKASEKLGGNFTDGALGGVVADGLAHSNMPHNQVGGVALGTYFAGLGLLTIAPTYSAPEGWTTTKSLTPEECNARGGVWIGNREVCLLPKGVS